MVLAFFADLDGEESQAALYLLEALVGEEGLHGVEGVEELEEAYEAADDFDFEEALLLDLILEHVVVLLGRLHHYVDHLLDVQGDLQVLLLDLHEHPRQLHLVLDLARAEEAA